MRAHISRFFENIVPPEHGRRFKMNKSYSNTEKVEIDAELQPERYKLLMGKTV